MNTREMREKKTGENTLIQFEFEKEEDQIL
jgi:hypothetical protein